MSKGWTGGRPGADFDSESWALHVCNDQDGNVVEQHVLYPRATRKKYYGNMARENPREGYAPIGLGCE